MKPVKPQWHLLLGTLLAITRVSSEQQVLQNDPSSMSLQCIPGQMIRDYMNDDLPAQEMGTDPDHIDIPQICYTRDPHFRLTVRAIHRDRAFDILIQDEFIPGSSDKYVDDDLVTYISEELEYGEMGLEQLQMEEEEAAVHPFDESLELILDTSKDCHALIRELVANNQANAVEGSPDSITTLHIINHIGSERGIRPSCIWLEAPDYEDRIAQLKRQSCDDCIGNSYEPPQRNADHVLAEFERMADVNVFVHAQARSPKIEDDEGFFSSLRSGMIYHKYANFVVNLDPFRPNNGGSEQAEELLFDWVRRVESACTWTDEEMPGQTEVKDDNGRIQYYELPPCKHPEVVGAVQHEIQTLCEPLVRDLMADVPNNGQVFYKRRGGTLQIELQNGKPTCALVEDKAKSKEEICPLGFPFATILKQIDADEQTRSALKNTPIVPGETVFLSLDPSVRTVKVNDTEYQLRSPGPVSYEANLSDLMSMLRVAQWAKSHPEESAQLHIMPLKGIIVDPNRHCYLGMLLENRGPEPQISGALCLHHCSQSQKHRWLESLRRDMKLLRDAQVEKSIVDVAKVSIDRDDQAWIVGLQQRRPREIHDRGWSDQAQDFVRELSKDLGDEEEITNDAVSEMDDETSSESQSPTQESEPQLETPIFPSSNDLDPLLTDDCLRSTSDEPYVDPENSNSSPPPLEVSPDLPIPEEDDSIRRSPSHSNAYKLGDSIIVPLNLECGTVSVSIYSSDLGKQDDKVDDSLGLTRLSEDQSEQVLVATNEMNELELRMWTKRVGRFALEHCGKFIKQICANKTVFGFPQHADFLILMLQIARDEEKGHIRCVRIKNWLSGF